MRKESVNRFDWTTIILYLTLIAVGWLSIYSSSYADIKMNPFDISTITGKQMIFICMACIIGSIIFLIDVKIITRFSFLIYFITVISLILVLLFGKEVGGAKAWFSFGSFGLQPSEFAKIGTALALAKFINQQKLYLDKNHILLISILIICIPIVLILLQPDAGSALVYLSLIIMFYREGLRLRYIMSIFIIGILGLLTLMIGVSKTIVLLLLLTVILLYLAKKYKHRFMMGLVFFILGAGVISTVNYTYQKILPAHQKQRIDLLVGKETNDLGTGYNLKQSKIAIGSGGLIGTGYLKGTQTKGNFIPEQNTDFIFCTIGEEFGFIGAFLIITLFSLLILRIIILSERQTSRFSRIFGYSVASILFSHTFINIGMTIGLVPTIGIPLPFLSYGGSSLLTFSMLLSIFLKLDSCRTHRF